MPDAPREHVCDARMRLPGLPLEQVVLGLRAARWARELPARRGVQLGVGRRAEGWLDVLCENRLE